MGFHDHSRHSKNPEVMTEQKATNVTWHEHNVTSEEREKLNNHKGAVVWFTGLSGCGKSTVANAVDDHYTCISNLRKCKCVRGKK